jgi:general stress protein YciG
MDMKNPHAAALGQLGGEARANMTSPEQRKEWARLGGMARAERHSKAEMSEWGKKGGRPPKKAAKGRTRRPEAGADK